MSAGHILVVDDEPDIREIVREILEDEHYDVAVAEHAAAARLAYNARRPDLVLLDIWMPDTDGITLLKEWARDHELPVPVVMMSGHGTVETAVEAMKTMVNAFSDYARPAPLHLQALNFNQLIADVVELYKSRANPVRYELDLDTRLPPLMADSGRLRQVLHNLLLNARDALANTDHPTQSISTRRVDEPHGAFVELVVRDNGPGFAPSVVDRLFEPYVTTRERGTGLGLAIVKKIVEEHNGTLAAGNLKDGGAVLTVRLPITEPVLREKSA